MDAIGKGATKLGYVMMLAGSFVLAILIATDLADEWGRYPAVVAFILMGMAIFTAGSWAYSRSSVSSDGDGS